MDIFLSDAAHWVFLGTVLLSVLMTGVFRWMALRWGIIDHPGTSKRKKHARPTPLFGGLGVYVAFSLVLLCVMIAEPSFTSGYLLPKHIFGILLGGLILVVGGAVDDKMDLSPKIQILFPIFSALTIVASGIGVAFLTNPFGTGIDLTTVQIELFSLWETPYFLVLFADVFAFFWILLSIYATKFLDGVDGLVSGITVISGIILFALSVKPDVGQPETAFIALVLAAAVLGFLVWNLPLPRARMFLGEGGSTFLGFALAVLAIISGAKLATALLLLGLPLVDMTIVIIRRLVARRSPFQGDRRHIHFQLLALTGDSVWKTLLILWSIVLLFGGLALFLEGVAKGIALLSLLFLAFFLGVFVFSKKRSL